MSKGSLRRPLLISEEQEKANWDLIFGNKSKDGSTNNVDTDASNVNTDAINANVTTDQDIKADTTSRIDTIGQNGNDGLHYEYELNKSTGEVEKKFDGC